MRQGMASDSGRLLEWHLVCDWFHGAINPTGSASKQKQIEIFSATGIRMAVLHSDVISVIATRLSQAWWLLYVRESVLSLFKLNVVCACALLYVYTPYPTLSLRRRLCAGNDTLTTPPRKITLEGGLN